MGMERVADDLNEVLEPTAHESVSGSCRYCEKSTNVCKRGRASCCEHQPAIRDHQVTCTCGLRRAAARDGVYQVTYDKLSVTRCRIAEPDVLHKGVEGDLVGKERVADDLDEVL